MNKSRETISKKFTKVCMALRSDRLLCSLGSGSNFIIIMVLKVTTMMFSSHTVIDSNEKSTHIELHYSNENNKNLIFTLKSLDCFFLQW